MCWWVGVLRDLSVGYVLGVVVVRWVLAFYVIVSVGFVLGVKLIFFVD